MEKNIQNLLLSLRLFDTKFSLLGDIQNGDTSKLQLRLIDFATKYAICGNVWHSYIAFFAINNQNPFSQSCEYKELSHNDSIYMLGGSDCALLFQLYNIDLEKELGFDSQFVKILSNFVSSNARSYNQIATTIIGKLCNILDNLQDLNKAVDVFAEVFRKCGVGELGLHKAFKIIKTEELQQKTTANLATILPITRTDERRLVDIIGCDLQKQQIVDNTEAFLQGRQANNVLLYGDGGTGKSSSIKAILNQYYEQGLRIIEVYKHQFSFISDIICQIKDRNYMFIIYLDDLSFEDFEIEYKYFKAIIDGGMETKPSNVLIYATSNRRHLIKESFADKNDMNFDGEMHKSDTIQEKLSLVSRFGLQIYFGAPNQLQYLEIVKQLAAKFNIQMESSELERKALTWSIRNNGKSGRTAQQFINSLL